MQIADFVTEFPTPDPFCLRVAAASSRFATIDGAGCRGGMETLVTESRSTPIVDPSDFVRAAFSRAACHADSTSPCHGGRTLGAGQDKVDETVDDLDEKFRRLSPWLERTLRHRYGGTTDVEDLVQESFLRLARYEPARRGLHPRALLLRIAKNLARDGHRHALARGFGRHVPIDAKNFDARLLGVPAEQYAQAAIKQAIMKLPAPLRDVFLLARFTPMTHAEIAARLGISTKTVEWRMSKAMALCLADLED